MAVASGFTDDVKEAIHAVYLPGQVHGYGPSRRGLAILRLYVVLVSLCIAVRESVVSWVVLL